MVELQLNISDSVLMGSGSSLEKMKEVISRYQLKFNNYRIKMNAYNSCKKNPVCAKVVSATNAEIMNLLYQDAY